MGEIGSVAMCRRIFKYQTTESGDIPFFKIGSFGGTPDAFISKDLFESFKVKYPYPEKGDVLISASGSIGRTVVFTGKDEYFQDSNIVWLKHNNSIINSFLNYLYSTVKWAGIEGTTIKRLYNDNILKTEAIIPTLLEQQKISDYLDGINYLITLHHSKSFGHILEAMVSCTLSWEQRKLGEIGMIITGSTPSTSLKYYYTDDSDEGIVWVTPTDIINNITLESEKRLTSLGQKIAHIVPKNTILVTCIASIGKNTMLIDRGSFNQQINGLIPYENKYEPYFLLTESFIWSNKMKSSAPAGTMQIVNRKEFSEIDACIPNKSEQNSVGSFFRTLDHLITLHQLEPFQLIFKAIAHRIIDYAKSKPPRHTKYEIIISFIKYYV